MVDQRMKRINEELGTQYSFAFIKENRIDHLLELRQNNIISTWILLNSEIGVEDCDYAVRIRPEERQCC